MSNKTCAPPAAMLSIADTARYLNLTTRTVQSMIADGRLRAYSLGPRVVRLRLDEIDAALKPYGGES